MLSTHTYFSSFEQTQVEAYCDAQTMQTAEQADIEAHSTQGLTDVTGVTSTIRAGKRVISVLLRDDGLLERPTVSVPAESLKQNRPLVVLLAL